MTNEEKFKTIGERLENFRNWCDKRVCENCECGLEEGTEGCVLSWLELECEPELKPCPFCRGRADVIKTHQLTETYYYVSCRNKNCNIRPFTSALPSEENVVALWNERREDGND